MKKILVIDDDRDILGVMLVILEEEGYAVLMLDHVQNLAQLLHTERPDLLILDIMIADVDGRHVCNLIKRGGLYPRMPILLYSAAMIPAEDLRACGADHFIEKPFDIADMLIIINRLLIGRPPFVNVAA